MIFNMTFQHQLAKIESVKVWVTRLPSRSHPPLSVQRHRVTCLPPKNVSAPWGGIGSRWLTIIIWQFNDIQYLLACQKNEPRPITLSKVAFPESQVFRRRHLGRRVIAVICLRWPTVSLMFVHHQFRKSPILKQVLSPNISWSLIIPQRLLYNRVCDIIDMFLPHKTQ